MLEVFKTLRDPGVSNRHRLSPNLLSSDFLMSSVSRIFSASFAWSLPEILRNRKSNYKLKPAAVCLHPLHLLSQFGILLLTLLQLKPDKWEMAWRGEGMIRYGTWGKDERTFSLVAWPSNMPIRSCKFITQSEVPVCFSRNLLAALCIWLKV